MAKTRYTIKGESAIKPMNLPEGFEVVEETNSFSKGVSGFLLEDSLTNAGDLFVYQEATGDGRHLTREAVKSLRDALTEWLSDSVVTLRVVHDASDWAGSDWRWYEVEPDKFIYNISETDARREAKWVGSERDALTYNEIENDYGIRAVTTWEV